MKFFRALMIALVLAFTVGARAQNRPTTQTLAYAGPYSATTTYASSNVVSVAGDYYVSLVSNNLNNAPASSPSQWATLGSTSSGCTTGGDVSGSCGSQTVVGLQGRPIVATAPTVGQALMWNGSQFVPTTPAIANMPSPSTLITDYDFHDGSGSTVSDVSGHANNMTFTSGTPGGTSAPRWVTNPVTGVGVGVAMGSDSLGSYGLPTSGGGTSCETIPVLQNAARTVMIQYFNPPVGTDGTQSGLVTYPDTFSIQDWLGSSNNSSGLDFSSYQWAMPLVVINGSGNLMWSQDNMVGFHTDFMVFNPSGSPTFYHDGQQLPAYNARAGSTSLTADHWVLGCNGAVQAGGDNPTAPSLVFRLSFWSNALNPIEVQQAYGFATNNLLISKGFQPQVTPSQVNNNQYFALGDSQTSGADGTGSGLQYPFAFCSVTANCYGTTYATTLTNFAGRPWIEGAFGLPGAGTGSLPSQIQSGLAKLRGDNDTLHVASVLIGTNGFGIPPCATIENLKQAGWDVWLQTLFSLSSTASTDQSNRDPYDYAELQSAFQCGATGIIDTSEDAFIGADGTNGTAPPGGVGAPGVHLSPSGYAWLMSINARVLNAYYQANPSVPTSYSASSVTMNGQDRYVTFNTGSNAIAASLPDCIGMVNMPYLFTVAGANSVTLTPASVSGQTETINGTSSYVMSANSVYKFFASTRSTATSAPGGCNWVPIQAPGGGASGIGGSGTNGTMPIFTSSGTVGDSPFAVSGANVNLNGSYVLHAGQVLNDISLRSCSNPTYKNNDGSGTTADGSWFYLCGFGGTQAAHVNGANLFWDMPVTPKVYTVSTLPSAATAGAGAMVQVSDATSFTPGTCTGGGSDYMLAVSNGSTWSCH
jgi:hypothetical protein